MTTARATVTALDQGIDAYLLENDRVSMSILPEKGADIYEWIHKASGIDVLWKSPWGLRRHRSNTTSSTSTSVAWLDAYEGGWQMLFPSGGGPSEYKGVELNFHGEASAVAWDVDEFGDSAAGAVLNLSTRLARSPFRVTRDMRLGSGDGHVTIIESVTNEGGEPMDYMWGHHPAYGAPFIGSQTVIDTNAAMVTTDDTLTGPTSKMTSGTTFPWPVGERDGVTTDLNAIPAEGAGIANMAYLHDFAGETAWYAFTNRQHGFGAGLAWKRADFPCAWFWQELNGSSGYPWYKAVYVMAIEPNTSFPGHGLAKMMEKTAMHRTLQPGESAGLEFVAVLFDATTGVSGIALDGTVTVKENV